MLWLKRNLVLVVGGVVALGLLGLAGYFLYAKMQQNAAVTEQLATTTEQHKTLVERNSHPNPENIAAAKEEQAKLAGFLAQVKTHFSPPPPTNQMTSREFRNYLDNTINELKRRADQAGVEVETNYWFTFEAHKKSVNFPTNHVGTLATQLAEVKALCKILYNAKVVSLKGVKRIAVTSDDIGSSDYTSAKGTTNNWAVITPYEVTFDTFSAELASVLEGLIRSKECFVVRNMTVEKASDADANTQEEGVTSTEGGPMDYQRMMMSRYGLGGPGRYYGRGMPMMPQAPVNPQPTQAKRDVVLEEKTLRVTLEVDSVRLKAR
ncbi:MAG: hypothetical protein FJ403_16750 [Verrucomicrobia bacterium]|nr:hypothetical protein [Verrucomicrobiota bacterium]